MTLRTTILVILLAGGPPLLCGCPAFRLPPVSDCAPFTTRCSAAGQPEVCSATRRWTPVGDMTCAEAQPGAVCVAPDDAGVAHCALSQSPSTEQQAPERAEGGVQ